MRSGAAALLLTVAHGGCRLAPQEEAAPPPVLTSPAPRVDAAAPRSAPLVDASRAALPEVQQPEPAPASLDAGAPPRPVDAASPLSADAAVEKPPAAPLRPPLPPGTWWKPTVAMTWDWQLKTPVDQSIDVQVYDIDLFENDASVMAELRARGRKVICYVNLGAWENWRPDADRFPKQLLGAAYHGFPDENWLDIRRLDLLGPIVRARLEMARNKGCDAVEPDNMDGYDTTAHEPTGFPLTYIDQIVYNRFVAAEAHARGLAVGLKNNVQQVTDLVNDFDFHVSEQCYEHDECELLMPFIAAGKPVFLAEYLLEPADFCSKATAAKISAIKKRNDLDAWRQTCP